MTTAITPTLPLNPTLPLELTRCDRCSARAGIRYLLVGGFDLVFCGHHDRRFGGSLLAAGATSAHIPE